ncbi:MAG: UbiA prenyltransferase family protein [Polyangiaceae bacterium]|nr:UbiA prenyltransferase family protein [Polyangiaceae bacterium]
MIRTLRPHQWVKNLFVMAPMFFHKALFLHSDAGVQINWIVFGRAMAATFVFCLLAGAVYTINDIVDADADREHPVKYTRPIASGEVPIGLAWLLAVMLVVVSLGFGFLLDWRFGAIATFYFVENIAYTFRLKKIAYLDVCLIALGFVLRVLAGGFATDVRVSIYMIVCTALLALFLGFGKRRHEVASENAEKQRSSLRAYNPTILNVALALTGGATVVTYVAYTLDTATRAFFRTNSLWLTTPFTVFGILRFLYLVSGRAGKGLKSESPTQEMLRDVPFVLNLVLWSIVVIAIVYKLRPSA